MSHAQTAGHIPLNAAINSEKESFLTAHNGLNGISTTINGNSSHDPPSPATDSPATPVSTSAPDVKIDMDYQEQESDVRHEPLPVKNIDFQSALVSNVALAETPIDSGLSFFFSRPPLRIIFLYPSSTPFRSCAHSFPFPTRRRASSRR